MFTVYAGGPAGLSEALSRPSCPPLLGLSDEYGVDHRVWRLDDLDQQATVTEGLRQVEAVIADGHHRHATALQHAAAQRAARAPPGPWQRTLMLLVDSDHHGPRLLGVHRVVTGVGDDLLARLAADWHLDPLPAETKVVLASLRGMHGPAFGLRLPDGSAYRLRVRDPGALVARVPGERSRLWRGLDTAVLHEVVLPGLGVPAEAVDYHGHPRAAVRQLGPGSAAFLLRPVALDTVRSLALAGEPMPAKTTWFRPKPRAGLVMRAVADPLPA